MTDAINNKHKNSFLGYLSLVCSTETYIVRDSKVIESLES